MRYASAVIGFILMVVGYALTKHNSFDWIVLAEFGACMYGAAWWVILGGDAK